MHSISVLSAVALVAACATGSAERSVRTSPATERDDAGTADVRYTVDVSDADRGTVEVTVELRRPEAPVTAFGLEKSWGGVRDIPSLVDEVRAMDGAGERLPVQVEGSHWVVEHPPGTTIRLRYEVSRSGSAGSRSPTSLMFLPRIGGKRVFLVGPVALMRPGYIGGDDVVTVEYEWSGVPNDWRVVTSASTEKRGTVRTRFSNALRVFWYGGEDLRVESRDVEGNQVHTAFSGVWPFERADVASLATDILEAERDFFGDHSQEYFAVASVPLILEGTPFEGAEIMSGTGLHRSLSMFLVPDKLPEDPNDSFELKHLLAHEFFHNWNGPKLLRMPDDQEARIYWFTEGFTEHMTRDILLDADLIDRQEYLADLNEQIAAYVANPLRTISNEKLAERYWTSKDGRTLAYQRGAMIALHVDREIENRSDGERDIGALMRHLHDTEPDPKVGANERVFAAIAKFTDSSYADRIRRHVVDGTPVELTSNLLGACYQLRQTRERRPVYGFALEESLSTGAIQGLDSNSPAAEVGIRQGQTITGVETKNGEQGPELHVSLVSESGEEQTVVVRPEFESRATPVYEYDRACREQEG